MMFAAAPTTPPPPVRGATPPPHKKIQRSQCKGGQIATPRRLTSATVLVDDVSHVELGMVLRSKSVANHAQTVVVTTTHTLVLDAIDVTIVTVYPNQANLIGHVVSFVPCF